MHVLFYFFPHSEGVATLMNDNRLQIEATIVHTCMRLRLWLFYILSFVRIEEAFR